MFNGNFNCFWSTLLLSAISSLFTFTWTVKIWIWSADILIWFGEHINCKHSIGSIVWQFSFDYSLDPEAFCEFGVVLMNANSISESKYVLKFLKGNLNFYTPPVFLTAIDIISEFVALLNSCFMHLIFGLSR